MLIKYLVIGYNYFFFISRDGWREFFLVVNFFKGWRFLKSLINILTDYF